MASDATAEQVHQISTPISIETRTRRWQGGDELEKSYQRLSHTNANSLLQTPLYFASLKQDRDRCSKLLRLKYHDSIADAVADLGKPEEIGQVFSGFQKYLYQQQGAVA